MFPSQLHSSGTGWPRFDAVCVDLESNLGSPRAVMESASVYAEQLRVHVHLAVSGDLSILQSG